VFRSTGAGSTHGLFRLAHLAVEFRPRIHPAIPIRLFRPGQGSWPVNLDRLTASSFSIFNNRFDLLFDWPQWTGLLLDAGGPGWQLECQALAIQGRGLRQLRRIATHLAAATDPKLHQPTVSPPWGVAPDRTSKIAVVRMHVGVVFENKRITVFGFTELHLRKTSGPARAGRSTAQGS
jgi:hypothetical protein